jgi:hypothetical protein
MKVMVPLKPIPAGCGAIPLSQPKNIVSKTNIIFKMIFMEEKINRLRLIYN